MTAQVCYSGLEVMDKYLNHLLQIELSSHETKRKYLKTDQLCETKLQVSTDNQVATLMALENSSNDMLW